MLALQAEGGRASVREMPRPRPKRGHALVRVLGHEFVGVVEGPAGSPLLGKRVVGEINLACGRCSWCAKGLGRHCPKRTVLGILGHPGAHAEWLTLPEENLHAVPPGLADEEAVFTEPLAAACEVLEQVSLTEETRAAVLGVGKLGTLVAQVLRAVGADVTLLGRRDVPKRAGFDLVVEATGSPAGMPRAIALVRPRGTIVWKTTHHAPARFDAAPIVVKEITVVGSRCGPFEPALDFLAKRAVDVAPLLSAELPLAEGGRALNLAGRRGVRKVLLRP